MRSMGIAVAGAAFLAVAPSSFAADRAGVLIGKSEMDAIACLGAPSFMKEYGPDTLIVWQGMRAGRGGMLLHNPNPYAPSTFVGARDETCQVTAKVRGGRIVAASSKSGGKILFNFQCGRMLSACE